MRPRPSVRLFAISLLVLLPAACSPAGTEPAPDLPQPTQPPGPTAAATPEPLDVPPGAVDWLTLHAVPFDTAEPGNGCADLEPLLDMIGDARVVALGEANHGAHEFQTMKHRILECLVQEKGFNIFAMEAGWAEGNHINAYIQTWNEQSNPLEGGVANFMFMGSDEIREMVEWMHQYNDSIGDGAKISFRGFDMQYADLLMADLLAYVNIVDPRNTSTVQANLECFKTYVINWSANPGAAKYSEKDEETKSLCRQGLQNIADLLLANRSAYETDASPVEFVEALQLVTLLQQNEELMNAPTIEESINVRDRYMAENTAWILEQAGPGAKMVIWAHNGHVSFSTDTWQTENGEHEMVWMGVHLKETLGDDLVVVGFAFHHGSFLAYGTSEATGVFLGYKNYEITAPFPNSYEAYLALANLPRLYLDLRPMRTDPELADWFLEPHWITVFGLGYIVDNPEANAENAALPEQYDILVYFEEISPLQR